MAELPRVIGILVGQLSSSRSLEGRRQGSNAVAIKCESRSARANPDLVAARFLLKPGRIYEEAMKAFEPYDSVKQENPEARAADRARSIR